MKKIIYPNDETSNIDDLLNRIPKENKYIVTTADLINYCYSLEERIEKAVEYVEEAKEQDFMWTPIFMKELLNILNGRSDE